MSDTAAQEKPELILEDESHVLVLYTGGTLGMLETESGLDTYPGYLADLLSSTHRFNDPAGQSIFSNSRSRTQYRSWNASRSASPSRIGTFGVEQKRSNERLLDPVLSSPRELAPVLSSPRDDANGSPSEPNTATAHLSTGPVQLRTLVTPRTATGRKIRYSILEYKHLIDSSNMTTTEFIYLVSDIERNYAAFDAFVVIMGTDTLAYTASVLSFLLENLGKSVVITGAQIPLSSLRNDAFENLLGALLLAGLYTIAEVTVFFHGNLFRGNRVYKQSSFDFDAFASPNHEPLAIYGIDLRVDWTLVCRPSAIAPFRAHRSLCAEVGHLRVIPTLSAASLKSALSEPIRGLVLESYGNGNALERDGWREIVKEACDRGVVIVNVTQCPRGFVRPAYAAGAWLSAAGVVSGLDMTTEAALAKLMYLLSKSELTPQDVRTLMQRPLRGELTADPPFTYIQDLDGPRSVRDFHASSTSELAPSVSAETLARAARSTLPERLAALAACGPAEMLSALLTAHPDADLDGSGCLHAAVRAGKTDCVRVLLARGASVHARHSALGKKARITPLALATPGSEVERLLIKAGALR